MATRHSTFLIALIALGAVTGPGLAARGGQKAPPPMVIAACPSTGIVISEAGSYVLDAGDSRLMDCTFSVNGTHGITITASNVTLHLNNNRLMFVGSPGTTAPGHGILVRAADGASWLRNVTITGAGAVVGFSSGIRLERVDKASISGVTAANNRTAGIETEDVTRFRLTESMMARNGTYGLKLRNSVQGSIRKNSINANGIRTTFSTVTGETTVIWPATAPGIGIGIHGGTENQVERNTVTGNFGDGIAVGKFSAADLGGDSFNNEISENLSSGNLSSRGGSFTNLFVATGSGGNRIHDNESLNLEDDNVGCGTNTWYNNTFITTFASNGTSPVDGTIAAPLSVIVGGVRPWVHTGAASCAR